MAVQRRRRAWLRVALLLAPLVLAGACGRGAADVSSRLRLAYFPNITHAVALIGVANDNFQRTLGPEVALEIKLFNAGPALIEAIFAGEVDIGYIGPNPAINGYVRSEGQALRIIAGAASGGAALVVHPEAGIHSPADLAGRRLATPQLGNTQDVALRSYLHQHGLSDREHGGDVTIMPIRNPDIISLFRRGDLDGAWVAEPWAARLVYEQGALIFLDERTLWPEGRFVSTHVIVRTAFLEQHPSLVTAFLRGHLQSVAELQADPASARLLINQELTRITGAPLPEQVLDQALARLDFTYDPLAETLFVSAEHAFELGFLGQNPPDLREIYALDLLNAVLTEQGLPPITQPARPAW
jgi:NitT/TauT family transport system substrate-binding protein